MVMVRIALEKLIYFLRIRIGKLNLPGGLRLWITILSLSFVGYSISISSEKLSNLSVDRFGIYWLFLALILSVFSIIINAVAWRYLLDWLGYDYRGLGIIRLYLSSNLLKYLPGGIWHFVERLRALRSYIKPGMALVAVVMEPVLMVSAALFWVPLGGWQSGLSLLPVIPAIFLIPRWREPLISRLEKEKAAQISKLDSGNNLTHEFENIDTARKEYPWPPLLMEMLFLAFRFAGFWCCLGAFSIQSSLPLGEWLASFTLAWAVGLVVPAAPGGLGVLEAALLLRLGFFVPRAPLLAVLLCYRLIVTLSDVVAAIFFPLRRFLLADLSKSLRKIFN